MMGWQWNQLNHMQIICTLLQTDNHTSAPSLNFFKRPDALPDAQPTVLIDWVGFSVPLNTSQVISGTGVKALKAI